MLTYFHLLIYLFIFTLQNYDFDKKETKEQNKFSNPGKLVEPQGIAYLGPIVFVPRLRVLATAKRSYETFTDTIYVMNSYSGLESLVVTGRVDTPHVTVKSLTVVAEGPNTPSSLISPISPFALTSFPPDAGFFINETLININGTDVRTSHFHAVPIDKDKFTSIKALPESPHYGSVVEVRGPSDRIHITLQNEGHVDATIGKYCSFYSEIDLFLYYENLKNVYLYAESYYYNL